MLNGGSLDGNALSISSAAGDAPAHEHDKAGEENDEIEQEHKPRSAVVAEMLAHGYTLSDTAVQKAIEVDGQWLMFNASTNTTLTLLARQMGHFPALLELLQSCCHRRQGSGREAWRHCQS